MLKCNWQNSFNYRKINKLVQSDINVTCFCKTNYGIAALLFSWLKIGIQFCILYSSQSQWPRGLRCGSAAERLLGWWLQIPSQAWMFFSCECHVLSGRGFCVGLITHPEESYQLDVSECNHEASIMRRPWPTRGCCATGKNTCYLDEMQAAKGYDTVLLKIHSFIRTVYSFQAFLLTFLTIRVLVALSY
jgi:hypothetical protein